MNPRFPAVLADDTHALPEWLLRWLSVDTAKLQGGTEHLRFARFPEGAGGLLVILALFVAFAAVFWIYRREGQASRARKRVLAVLRSGLITLVALVLLYPVLEVDRREELRASTILLVDDSLSMGIRDRYASDVPRRDALALALGLEPGLVPETNRLELVRRGFERATPPVLRALERANRLEAYSFSDLPIRALAVGASPPPEPSPSGDGTPESAAAPQTPLAIAPRGTMTNIAGALRAAVEESGADRIAAIVLVTDGRVTAGEDLEGSAAFLRERGIPVHAVGVGDPSPVRNLRVGAVLANERVFSGDPVALDVRIEEQGFDEETVGVEVFDAFEPPGEAARAPVRIDQAQVSFASGRSEATASFRVDTKEVGRHRLTVRIEAHAEEMFQDDNERTAVVEVLKEASKALLLAGAPTFEYRFLKNLLRRDARIHLAAWLMSADADYPQEGNTTLTKLPDTAKELFEYDVLILLDPNPQGLPPGFPALLAEFVGRHRGGLIYGAGDKYAATLFDSAAAAPLGEMLPVVIDDAELKDELERGRFYEREWPLEPTLAAIDHGATRLSREPERNRDRWAEVAGIYWSLPVKKAKPGATVLFVHPDPALARDGQPRPIFLTQFYEGGRTAFLGIDSTWNWRATAEEVYDRFWIQTIRWVSEGRLLGDRRRLIECDREAYELGDVIRISLRLEDENYRPVDAEEASVTVEAPNGATEEWKLQRDAFSPGWFRGSYSPRFLGVHKLRIEGGAPRVVRVDPPLLEFGSPRMEEEALRELALATGGSYLTISELASLPARIPDRRQVVVTSDEPIPLWDNALILGLLAAFLTLEWILRKLSRLL